MIRYLSLMMKNRRICYQNITTNGVYTHIYVISTLITLDYLHHWNDSGTKVYFLSLVSIHDFINQLLNYSGEILSISKSSRSSIETFSSPSQHTSTSKSGSVNFS